MGTGVLTVSEDSVSGFTTSFSGDYIQSSSSGSQEATGTIAAGQHVIHVTITNSVCSHILLKHPDSRRTTTVPKYEIIMEGPPSPFVASL